MATIKHNNARTDAIRIRPTTPELTRAEVSLPLIYIMRWLRGPSPNWAAAATLVPKHGRNRYNEVGDNTRDVTIAHTLSELSE